MPSFCKNWWERLQGMPGVSLFSEMVLAEIKRNTSCTLGVFCAEVWHCWAEQATCPQKAEVLSQIT